MMNVGEINKYLEELAPRGASWEKDNVGLQLGKLSDKVSNILLALEVNDEVVEQSISNNCNLIITHHPLIFKPLNKLSFDDDDKARQINSLIKNNVSVLSAHTNLDFAKNGVSFQLAKKIGLKNIKFLVNQDSNQSKISVFVPTDSLSPVRNTMCSEGAGKIGEYSYCSFSTNGIGTFKGSENSDPTIGRKLKLEKAEEVKLEVIVDNWNLSKVINSMLAVHPYEEPAYDVVPLKNKNINYGFGAIGELETSLSNNNFLKMVCKLLRCKGLRYTQGNRSRISKVAVCGGSGSDLVGQAIKQSADAFITADIKYHTFQDAENKILLVDAGHYETEIHSIEYLKSHLTKFVKSKNQKIKVLKYNGSTNPVKFYNN